VNAPAPLPRFQPLPEDEPLRLAWPTPNRFLLTAPENFFARTRANADYGKPGFTRECGKRFHRGVDIAPVSVTPTGQTTLVVFTDCATGRHYESVEPTFLPHDDVSCVCDGAVRELVDDEAASDYGKHVLIEHRWPHSDEPFFTLYAHLAEIRIVPVATGIRQGTMIGRMGQTSRSADARNWMAIAPHLHFEVWDAQRRPFNPVAFLHRFLPQ
jgi:murein DD-endopeptidase MepM/ murein hydrolase activator NlpD